jgi:hypothetical protein
MQGEYSLFGNNNILLPIKNEVEKRIENLEEENFSLKKRIFEISVFENEKYELKRVILQKISIIEGIVNYLNANHSVVIGNDPKFLKYFGYVLYNHDANDIFLAGFLIAHAGWISFREVRGETKKIWTYLYTNDPERLNNSIVFPKDIVPYIIKYFPNTIFSKILSFETFKNDEEMSENEKILNFQKSMLMQIKRRSGNEIITMKSSDNFLDISKGFVTSFYEMQILTYIHYKISMFLEYYTLCVKEKDKSYKI